MVIDFRRLHVAFAPSVHVVPTHSPFLYSLNSTRLFSLTGSSQATGYSRIHLHRICHSAINPGRCSAPITLIQFFFRVAYPGSAFPLQCVVEPKREKISLILIQLAFPCSTLRPHMCHTYPSEGSIPLFS